MIDAAEKPLREISLPSNEDSWPILEPKRNPARDDTQLLLLDRSNDTFTSNVTGNNSTRRASKEDVTQLSLAENVQFGKEITQDARPTTVKSEISSNKDQGSTRNLRSQV